MDFPKDFTERAKAAYPDCTALHTALFWGECVAGNYLYEGAEADKTNSEKRLLLMEFNELLHKNQRFV